MCIYIYISSISCSINRHIENTLSHVGISTKLLMFTNFVKEDSGTDRNRTSHDNIRQAIRFQKTQHFTIFNGKVMNQSMTINDNQLHLVHRFHSISPHLSIFWFSVLTSFCRLPFSTKFFSLQLSNCVSGWGFQIIHTKMESIMLKTDLGGGFNPFEKYWSNWIISQSRGENKKYLKPPPPPPRD